jgi:predicted Rossmann fold nucleotide-binding protein DprA/Smf involved in DNA uptake
LHPNRVPRRALRSDDTDALWGVSIEQNREDLAVPGPVDKLASCGCHRLICDGARLREDSLKASHPAPTT